MRISFDLDDTLICYSYGAQQEPNRVPRVLQHWLQEPLRRGARDLLLKLQKEGHELWIYTSSNRSSFGVRWWLRCYGVRVAKVINGATHEKAVRPDADGRRPTKNPARFDIDLHIDDSEGVKREGEMYGFEVFVIARDDPDWTEKILAKLDSLNN